MPSATFFPDLDLGSGPLPETLSLQLPCPLQVPAATLGFSHSAARTVALSREGEMHRDDSLYQPSGAGGTRMAEGGTPRSVAYITVQLFVKYLSLMLEFMIPEDSTLVYLIHYHHPRGQHIHLFLVNE